MTQTRLFRLAPEALTVSAHYRPGEGWHASVSVRLGDENWSDVRPASYSHLTQQELFDVLAAELERALGL